MFPDKRGKCFAVFFQFFLPYAANAGKLNKRNRFLAAHIIQAGIGENNIRRDGFFYSDLFPQFPQFFKKSFVNFHGFTD